MQFSHDPIEHTWPSVCHPQSGSIGLVVKHVIIYVPIGHIGPPVSHDLQYMEFSHVPIEHIWPSVCHPQSVSIGLVVNHVVISCPNRAHRTLSVSWLEELHVVISFPNRAHRTWLSFISQVLTFWYHPTMLVLRIIESQVTTSERSGLLQPFLHLAVGCANVTLLSYDGHFCDKNINIWKCSCDNCDFYRTRTCSTPCSVLMSQ